MDKFGEQILEVIMKIRRSIKRSDTKSIFQLITMDAATNITMEDTKEKIQTLAETSVVENRQTKQISNIAKNGIVETKHQVSERGNIQTPNCNMENFKFQISFLQQENIFIKQE